MNIGMHFVIGWPQAIYLTCLMINIVGGLYLWGTPRTGTHSLAGPIGGILGFALLYWGGFFG